MKIAVVGAPRISTPYKNIENHCEELYTRVVQKGHQVDWFVQAKYTNQSPFSVSYYKNIRVIALVSLPGKKLDFWLNSALNSICATVGNYDVIHFHDLNGAWFSWFTKLFSNSKVILTCKQLNYQKYQKRKFLDRLLISIERIAVKSADEIVVDSKTLGTYFKQEYGFASHYIPNVPSRYLPTNSDFSYGKILGLNKGRYLLHLGKLEPTQRLDLLIKAFQEVQPSGWKLVIAGEIGDYPEYVAKLLRIAKQQDNIIFVNEVRGNFLAEIVRYAGLFVVPSKEKNLRFPLQMLEAMREGIPVLASDIAIHQELIGSDRGLLFSSEQLDSLVSQLARAMSDPDLLRAAAKRAQTYVAINHNWDRVVYKNLFLYFKDLVSPQEGDSKYRTLNH